MLHDYLSEKHKKKKDKRRKFFLIFAILAVAAFFAALWWILFRSPLLKVEDILVRGNTAVPSGDVITLLDGVVLKEHGFTRSLFGPKNMLSWPHALTSSDLAQNPQLKSVTLTKDYWTHTVIADVTERKPFAIWCNMPGVNADGNPDGNEACFWFDQEGSLFESAFDTEGSALFAVHDYSQDNAVLGGSILPGVFVPNLVSILNVLRESNLDIKEVALHDISLQEIDVSTYNGPTIYFSLRFSPDADLSVLQSVMAQPSFAALQYVDFRVQNRAYYE